jgi:hypothetical protein
MAMQTPSIAAPAPRRPGRRLGLGLAVGAVVAVALGIGLWRADRHGSTTDPAAPPPAAVERPAGGGAAETVATVYIVGSAAEADKLQHAIAEGDAIRATMGEAALDSSVLVVASEQDEAVLQMLAEQDAIRAQLGLPQHRFVDLRAPAAGVPSQEPAAYSDAEMYQRWLQAQGAPAPAAGLRPGGAATETPGPMGGLAELMRDGGVPASVGFHPGTGSCGTVAEATTC